MSNTYLKLTTAVMLHLGIILTLEADVRFIESHLIGSTLAQEVIHTYESTGKIAEQHAYIANWNLAAGILMILLGYALHLWIVKREERPVKVRAKKTKPKKAFFWMSVKI